MAMASRLARTALFALAVSGYVAMAAARVGSAPRQPAATPATAPGTVDLRAALDTYCVACHNQRLKTAGLTLDTIDAASPHTTPEIWEKVIARLSAGTMPPAGRPRPDAAAAHAIVTSIAADIDRAWLASPVTGRVSAVHRLNRSPSTATPSAICWRWTRAPLT